MLVADLAQALQIALGWDVPAGAAGHRLDDDGGHIGGVVQCQDAGLQLHQRVFGPDGLLVVDVGMVHRVVDEAHVVHTRQQLRAIHLAVGGQPAHAHAAEVDAVVTLFAADEDLAMAFAAGAVVSQGHLERGVGGFGAGVAEQHLVEVAGRHLGNPLRRQESLVVAGLEGGGVVERVGLFLDGFVDRLAVVAGADAPQAGDAIEHLPAVMRCEVHAVGGHEHTGVFFEVAVGCEGQPLVVHGQVVG